MEKIGLSSTHTHVQKALKAVGRFISFDKGGNGVLLHPLGQGIQGWRLEEEDDRVRAVVAVEQLEDCIYSTACPSNFIERLKIEMRNFPVWHDDGMNMLAYLFSPNPERFVFRAGRGKRRGKEAAAIRQ